MSAHQPALGFLYCRCGRCLDGREQNVIAVEVGARAARYFADCPLRREAGAGFVAWRATNELRYHFGLPLLAR